MNHANGPGTFLPIYAPIHAPQKCVYNSLLLVLRILTKALVVPARFPLSTALAVQGRCQPSTALGAREPNRPPS